MKIWTAYVWAIQISTVFNNFYFAKINHSSRILNHDSEEILSHTQSISSKSNQLTSQKADSTRISRRHLNRIRYEERIEEIIQQYKSIHNLRNLVPWSSTVAIPSGLHFSSSTQHTKEYIAEKKRICSQKLVIGHYHCPTQIGNRMFEFLNAFAVAIITNRTLVWNFCVGGHCHDSPLSECTPMLHRKRWIPSFVGMSNLLDDFSCSDVDNLESASPYVDDNYRLAQLDLTNKKSTKLHQLRKYIQSWMYTKKSHILELTDHRLTSSLEIVQLSCQGIDRLPTAGFLDIGETFHIESYFMSFPGANLSYSVHLRAQDLFVLGADYSLGRLFWEAFEFTSLIRGMNNNLPVYTAASNSIAVDRSENRSSETSTVSSHILLEDLFRPLNGDTDTSNQHMKTLIIGLHIRHSDRSDLGLKDNGEAHCLESLVHSLVDFSGQAYHQNGSVVSKFNSCLVVIASDRPLAIRRNKDFATNHLHCQVVARGINTEYVYKPGADEHGPQGDSIYSVADVELLSRSHFFIGTPGSTYSTLIASLVRSKPAFDEHRQRDIDNGNNGESYSAHLHKDIPYFVTGLLPNDQQMEVYIGDTFWLPSCLPKDSSDVESQSLAAADSNIIGVISPLTNERQSNHHGSVTSNSETQKHPFQWQCENLESSGVAELISTYIASSHEHIYELYMDWFVCISFFGALAMIIVFLVLLYFYNKRKCLNIMMGRR